MFSKIQWNPQLIFSIVGLIVIFSYSFFFNNKSKKLDKIKGKEVGDGQHGTDRFMTKKEARTLYKAVKLPDTIEDHCNEFESGRLISYYPDTREALIDTSNTHAKITAPTESKKTTSYVIPNIQYNLMAGTSMIIPDMKGELYRLTSGDAERLGYKVCKIDFINTNDSYTFDYFADINEYLNHYKVFDDLSSKAAAEDAAGELASTVVHSRQRSDSENTFFLGASEGVIHAITLLVSMFGKPEQKHLSSVNNIVQEMLQRPKTKNDITPQIIKLINPLPQDFGAKKNLGAAFAAAMETESNIYASVLGDLRPFVNSLGEQIIAHPHNVNTFDYMDLIKGKTVLYIVMPEHKPQFRVYGQTIITKIYNQLANYAAQHDGKLPKRVYVPFEEFGLYEKIENIKDWMAYARGMGFIIDLIYQDSAQVKEKYGDNIEHILSSQCATSIYLGLGPEDTEIAERISKACGTKTIKTGSISQNYDNKSGSWFGGSNVSQTEQMMERPLMNPSEILHMDTNGIKLLLRRGNYPFKCSLTPYFEDEWPLKPRSKSSIKIPMEDSPINMMTFNELVIAIADYVGMAENLENLDSSTQQNNEVVVLDDTRTRAKKELLNITKDQHVIELIEQKKYNEFFKYMDKYKMKITRFELNKLIEPFIEEKRR